MDFFYHIKRLLRLDVIWYVQTKKMLLKLKDVSRECHITIILSCLSENIM